MCQTTHHGAERAAGLEHGAAHDDDHDAWTRRDFLVRSGLAAAGASVLFGSGPAHAAARHRQPGLVGQLAALQTDRVLVLVQLQGGNDGLNTVVPVGNDLYYNARPQVALAKGQTWRLSDDYGMHPALRPLERMWGDGHMGVVHSVGYPNQSLSHFEGIDVWASSRTENARTGWTAEAVARLGVTPQAPPSVQVGASYPLLLRGPDDVGGMTLTDPGMLDRIVSTGELYGTDGLPDTPYGRALGHVRRTANDADTYAGAMSAAAGGVQNAAEYPDTTFGRSLAAVARLVKGRLDTRVYLVRLGSFDTHAGQLDQHHKLLDVLGRSLAAFYADLGDSGDAGRTLTMTFSEFGRRVNQNGSAGTDHGAAAPVFLFGPAVQGGFHGAGPDLAGVDRSGNLPVSTDFRSVYRTVLGSWLGLGDDASAAILGGTYDPLDVLAARATSVDETGAVQALELLPPAPNPVRTRTVVAFSTGPADHAELALFDTTGRRVVTVAEGAFGPGRQTATLDAAGLAAGVYVLRLQTASGVRAQTLTVVR